MNIAIMGFGTVGTGIEEILFDKNELLLQNGYDIKISKVLIANANKKRNPKNKNIVFTDNFDEILNSDAHTVIDVTSNLEETYKRIIALMNAGKNIITANKAVVSKYFEELNEIAIKNNVYFSYEASVGGAIPIIHPLMEELAFNNIYEVSGILNGTSNFILSKMERENLDYNTVLREAQKLGYAEADPTADVCGFDAQRKIRILSSLAYNSKINEDEILTIGIENISKCDIDFAKSKNYSIRLIAKSKLINDKINISVMPVFVKDEFFKNTLDSLNTVKIIGDNFGEYRFFGAGAGKLETADAVIRDLLRIVSNKEVKTFYNNENKYEISFNLKNKFYIRVKDINEKLENIADEVTKFQDFNYILTKKINFTELKEVLNSYENIFAAAAWEEK